MNDIPYTTPEEDPFNTRPVFLEPRRRRSSLFDKWIQEQQKPPDKDSPTPSQNKAYLAVPNFSKDDTVTLDNYDIVDDDDIPAAPDAKELATPSTTRPRPTSKLLHTSGSFRNFNPFRPAASISPSLPDDSPRSSKFSFLPLTPRHSMDVNMVKSKSASHQHTRSSSLGAFGFSVSGNSGVATITPTARNRPSILGHFASLSTSEAPVSLDTALTPSRPSISSGDTYTSGTPTTESDLPLTPSRLNFMDSLRFRTKSNGGVFASASAIFSSGSLPSKQARSSEDQNGNLVVATDDVDPLATATITQRPQSTRRPLAQKPPSILTNVSSAYDQDEGDDTYHTVKQPVKQPRPHVLYPSGSTLPRVRLTTFSTRHKKKKKLVVRGVGPNEVRKFEGVKQWCESFGEVSQIIRMPNGDLHVHFRLAEVADTVCRLRARVHIAGVGSVQLSWLTGDQR